MSAITTHVLDTARGQPASGVPVVLSVRADSGEWREITSTHTARGTYRVVFDTAAYFRAWNIEGFYPEVEVMFEIRDPAQDYHVPLLLSPYGYSTYRGT
jgi:5-hydroxyisourate hydrolase